MFNIHAEAEGRDRTKDLRFSILGIFFKHITAEKKGFDLRGLVIENYKEHHLGFEISQEDKVKLCSLASNKLRVDSCDGLDFSTVSHYHQKPILELTTYYGQHKKSEIYIHNTRGRENSVNTDRLITHIFNYQTRKLKTRIETSLGQPLQKDDPSAPGGAL